MREIKFRAFDTVKKEWLDSDELTFGHGNWFKNFRDVEDYVALPVDEGEVVITQYTGLKDSIDREIFEGDVLEDAIPNKRYEVIWDEYAGMFLFNPVGTKGEAVDYYEFESEVSSSATIVVGNVFENPELLEEKQ